jgi:hypothetical protein
MTDKVFKVGQVWKTGDGDIETITSINGSCEHPIKTSRGSYTFKGRFYWDEESELDLIELVTDVEEKPVPKFKVGQVWRTRGGDSKTITSTTSDLFGDGEYPIETNGYHTYTPEGRYYGSHYACVESKYDLIELITDVPEEKPVTEVKTMSTGEAFALVYSKEGSKITRVDWDEKYLTVDASGYPCNSKGDCVNLNSFFRNTRWIEVVEPREYWVNVYPNDLSGHIHDTKAKADFTASSNRIECVHVKEVRETE